ncbi:hypothetical protein V5O48_008604 [Marasmius crinis-equi]|uniref:MICOS complex subunit MIC12 n=1 Tax=Marasmius crinis-equi TaxID=585013 RepID=A0ABR3FDH2_9AGAR
MSFLIGPVSGALVAGGVYYGFSNLIQTRTKQISIDLHIQSVRLVETPTLVQAPPSAASRVVEKPFLAIVQAKWNEELEGVFRWCRDVDTRVVDWGRRTVYGTQDKQ